MLCGRKADACITFGTRSQQPNNCGRVRCPAWSGLFQGSRVPTDTTRHDSVLHMERRQEHHEVETLEKLTRAVRWELGRQVSSTKRKADDNWVFDARGIKKRLLGGPTCTVRHGFIMTGRPVFAVASSHVGPSEVGRRFALLPPRRICPRISGSEGGIATFMGGLYRPLGTSGPFFEVFLRYPSLYRGKHIWAGDVFLCYRNRMVTFGVQVSTGCHPCDFMGVGETFYL